MEGFDNMPDALPRLYDGHNVGVQCCSVRGEPEAVRRQDAPDWIPKTDLHRTAPSERKAFYGDGTLLRVDLQCIAKSQAETGFFENAIKSAPSTDALMWRVEVLTAIAGRPSGRPH